MGVNEITAMFGTFLILVVLQDMAESWFDHYKAKRKR